MGSSPRSNIQMRALVAVLALGTLYACGASTPTAPQPSPTMTPHSSTSSSPTPSAATGSQLQVAGDLNGEITNIKATCGQQQVVGNGYTANYSSATGTLNGDAFLVDIYDPAGQGSLEGQFHVYVRVTPPTSDYYTWFTQSSDRISDFNSTGGVKVAATIPPKTSADIQAGGLSPTSPITLTGRIVC